MEKFTVKTVVEALVDVAFEVEAPTAAEARRLVLQGAGLVISEHVDWETTDFKSVEIDGEWVSPEAATAAED